MKQSRSGASPKALQPVVVSTYEVTYEPILDPAYRRLPDQVKADVERLNHEVQIRPRNAIGELEALLTQYPRLPQLYNYLVIAYAGIGEGEKAEAIAQAGIRVNPDYLFTRLNYAEFCLHRKEYAKVVEVLDHKFDLHQLYPKRKRFHISEVVNFMGVVGLYFYETQQRELAHQYYVILRKLDPTHPATRRLKRRLAPNLFDRLLARLTH